MRILITDDKPENISVVTALIHKSLLDAGIKVSLPESSITTPIDNGDVEVKRLAYESGETPIVIAVEDNEDLIDNSGSFPVLRGSRHSVFFVSGLVIDGWSTKEIGDTLGISEEEIGACVDFVQEVGGE